MGSMEVEQIKSEVLRTDQLIQMHTGRIPEFFRPPYIDLSETLFNSVDKPFICGSDCKDWDDSVSCDVVYFCMKIVNYKVFQEQKHAVGVKTDCKITMFF